VKRTIAVDFETYYDDECSVRTLGNWAYTQHPEWDAYLISVCDGAETWVGHPRDFNFSALAGNTLVSHNAFFDRSVNRRLVELGRHEAPGLDADWHCSSNLGAYLCGGARSLKDVSKKLLGVELSKDVRDAAKGKRWDDMVAAGTSEDMLKYARRDALLCWQIWDRFSGRMPAWEHQLSDLTIRRSEHGMHINRPLLETYIQALQQAVFATEKLIPWIEAGHKPTSPKAFAEWCRKDNIPVPPTKTDDEEGLELWVETYAPGRAWVQSVGAWRSLNKTLKKFQLVLSRLKPDDTMDFGLKYFGAHTGRWSGDAGFNAQNMRKQPILLRDDWTMIVDKFEADRLLSEFAERMKDVPKHLQHNFCPPGCQMAIDERALITPRPGHKFIISDLSQIEPRTLNTLTGNDALLDQIRGGLGIYEAFARQSLKYTDPAPLKKKDPRLYALAKAEVLGLGYQCGKARFPEVAWAMAGLRITEEESGPIVDGFRESNPLTVGLWNRLDAAFKASTGSDFEMELPSGRTLHYGKVRQSRRIEVDDETGMPKSKVVYTAEVGNRRVSLYGGKLCENITQSVARDVFATHLLALDAAGLNPLFHVHDEVICEVTPDVPKEAVLDIMAKAPTWFAKCPVAAEAVEADRYLK
jgi:DNA polymerase